MHIEAFDISNEELEEAIKKTLDSPTMTTVTPSQVLCIWAKSFLAVRDKQLGGYSRPSVMIPEEVYFELLSLLQTLLGATINLLGITNIKKEAFEKTKSNVDDLMEELENNKKKRENK